MPRAFGSIASVQVPNPGAGVEWSFHTPAGTFALVYCISFVFTTGGVAANRCVGITHQSGGGGNGGLWRAGAIQTATLVNTYTFPATVLGQSDPIGAPGVLLIPGPGPLSLASSRTPIPAVISGSTHGLQATDAYTNIWLLVETWHE